MVIFNSYVSHYQRVSVLLCGVQKNCSWTLQLSVGQFPVCLEQHMRTLLKPKSTLGEDLNFYWSHPLQYLLKHVQSEVENTFHRGISSECKKKIMLLEARRAAIPHCWKQKKKTCLFRQIYCFPWPTCGFLC